MAGRNRGRMTETVSTPSLVASAVTYSGSMPRIWRQKQAWQVEAWRQYRICPELQFAAGWIANALSRCVLEPGEVTDDGKIRATGDKTVQQALDLLFAGSQGQSGLLHSFGLHLTVAGECYLVGRIIKDQEGNKVSDAKAWEIVGIHEMSVSGNSWSIIDADDQHHVSVLDPEDTVIRIWRPDPAHRMQATSPVRALIGTLEEIELYSAHIRKQLTSRLAGAGVMWVPQSMELPELDDGEDAGAQDVASKLLKILGATASKAIQDQGSASAHVPIVISIPDELVEKMPERPMQFWSEFDDKVMESRKAAITRFGTGMDLPPEVINGMTSGASASGGQGAGASHWGAFQIAEEAIKMHAEPLLEIIASSLVLAYVRPITGNARAALVSNTQALKLQPDRSKEAAEMADRGRLSDAAILRYSGFDPENDAPSDDEKKQWLARQIVKGSVTPAQVAWAARYLGLSDFPTDDAEVAPGTNQRQDPSLIEHPVGNRPPDREHSLQNLALLTAASEPMMLRALERVGNRLRSRGCRPDGVPAAEVYLYADISSADDLLCDAWSMVPQVAEGLCDADELASRLDQYAQDLLVRRVPYSRTTMTRHLSLVGSK